MILIQEIVITHLYSDQTICLLSFWVGKNIVKVNLYLLKNNRDIRAEISKKACI